MESSAPWLDTAQLLDRADTRLTNIAAALLMREAPDEARQRQLLWLVAANPGLRAQMEGGEIANISNHFINETMSAVQLVLQHADYLHQKGDPQRAREYLGRKTREALAKSDDPLDRGTPIIRQHAAALLLDACQQAGIEIWPSASEEATKRAHAIILEKLNAFADKLTPAQWQGDKHFCAFATGKEWGDAWKAPEATVPGTEIGDLRRQFVVPLTMSLRQIESSARRGDWGAVVSSLTAMRWSGASPLEQKSAAIVIEGYREHLGVDLGAFSRQSARQI